MSKDKMYRYSDTGAVLRMDTFEVIRTTPRGKVINMYGKDRFVLNDSRKRFAHETKELALASFIARKHRQISILSHQLDIAKKALNLTSTHTPDTLPPYSRLIADTISIFN